MTDSTLFAEEAAPVVKVAVPPKGTTLVSNGHVLLDPLATEEARKFFDVPKRSEKPDDFDWSPENADVLTPEQPATACYLNCWDQVVIRQERAWDQDDDVYVRIGVHALPALIARLQSMLPNTTKSSTTK